MLKDRYYYSQTEELNLSSGLLLSHKILHKYWLTTLPIAHTLLSSF